MLNQYDLLMLKEYEGEGMEDGCSFFKIQLKGSFNIKLVYH